MKRSKSQGINTPAKKGRVVARRATTKTFKAVPRSLRNYSSGFPKQLMITHRFTMPIQLSWSTTSTGAGYLSFGVNCLYDPYLAVGGNQPLYFDQLTAIYNHYTVLKSRMKVNVVSNRTDAFVSGIYIDDDASPAYTDLNYLTQQPSAVFLTSHRDAEVVRLYKNWDAKTAFGPNPTDNTTLQGDVSSNPTETQAFVVFARNVDITSPTTVYDAYVTIEFDTIWNELKTIVGS